MDKTYPLIMLIVLWSQFGLAVSQVLLLVVGYFLYDESGPPRWYMGIVASSSGVFLMLMGIVLGVLYWHA